MSEEETLDDELKKLKDCPAELVDLFDASKSAWRKAVIKEFISLHDWKTAVTTRLARIETYEKVIIGLLVVIVGVFAKTILPEVFEYLTRIV